LGFWHKEQITILLTTACNLNCFYCYMPKLTVQKEDRVIDTDFARVGIKDYFETGGRKSVRFFSPGEPTMAFDKMREIADYARELAGKELVIELETNGYFRETIADWVDNNVDILWISCDGPPSIQDRQRPSVDGANSSSIVTENIKRFALSPNLQFGVRSTISDEHLDKQTELVDFFAELNVRHLSSAPTYRSKINTRISRTPLMAFAEGFVPAFSRAKDKGMTYLNLLIVNFDEEVDIYCQSSIPTPRLTPDGYVSCCDWAALGPKYMPRGVLQELLIGEYNHLEGKIHYFQDRIDQIRQRNIEFLSSGDCKDCEILRHCAGGCVGKIASVTDDLFRMDRNWCRAARYLYRNLDIEGPFPVLNP